MAFEEGKPNNYSQPEGKVLAAEKRQFVISPRRMGVIGTMAVQPLAFSFIEQTLRASPDIEVIETIGPRGLVGTLTDGMPGPPAVITARMTPQNAESLNQQGRGELIVELDQPLTLSAGFMQQPAMVLDAVPAGSQVPITVIVVGPDNSPIEGAEVHLFGSLFPATGITDHRGQVTLSLLGDTPQSVRGIYVRPKSDYWSFYQSQPSVEATQPNICVLKPLSSTLPNFPRQQVTGWGQKVMRLDQLPPNYRGQGVKIGLVDSGAATTHSDLRNIRYGFDVVNKKVNPDTWNQDTIAHGSHCAGIIAGDIDNGTGIRGFAPDAEVHVCKVFPGGRVSSVIDALEYCIERQIDVVNLNLCTNEPSEALEQHLLRATRLGIACIVAAGNSGGPVQYPASSPNVLAVTAIGKLGEFPQDSYHTQTVPSGVGGGGGYFSPKFTAFGPEIAVCGPGVAILSSVPPDNFAVWDGTSLAASHITGLAALVLAHHPDFQGSFKARDARRVARLFQILISSVQPLSFLDPRRTGFGIPDVMVALGLAPPPHAAFLQAPAMSSPFAQPTGAMYTLGSQFAHRGSPDPWLTSGVDPLTAVYMQQSQLWPRSWVGSILEQLSGFGGSPTPGRGPGARPWF
jgi:subtilisin